jgi:hypothetical protein
MLMVPYLLQSNISAGQASTHTARGVHNAARATAYDPLDLIHLVVYISTRCKRRDVVRT